MSYYAWALCILEFNYLNLQKYEKLESVEVAAWEVGNTAFSFLGLSHTQE